MLNEGLNVFSYIVFFLLVQVTNLKVNWTTPHLATHHKVHSRRKLSPKAKPITVHVPAVSTHTQVEAEVKRLPAVKRERAVRRARVASIVTTTVVSIATKRRNNRQAMKTMNLRMMS